MPDLPTSETAEGQQTDYRRIIVTFKIVYESDVPPGFDADLALDQVLAKAPGDFVLTGHDELMDDAYDMHALGWNITTSEWGDIGTGEHASPPPTSETAEGRKERNA